MEAVRMRGKKTANLHDDVHPVLMFLADLNRIPLHTVQNHILRFADLSKVPGLKFEALGSNTIGEARLPMLEDELMASNGAAAPKSKEAAGV